MFCSKCGSEIQANEKFCPRCGAPNETFRPDVPQTPRSAGGRDSSSPGKSASVNVIGPVSSVIALISLFLPFLTASALGFSQSVNFFELMSEADADIMNVIAVICILWIALTHLLRHPKISLIGAIGLVASLILVCVLYSDINDFGIVSFGFGFWLFFAATVACIAAPFIKLRN